LPASGRVWWDARSGSIFGESYLYNQPVRGLVAHAAINTAILALSALVVRHVCGIGLGVVTGWPGSGRWSNSCACCRCCRCPFLRS
jgi:ABC-type dipeptide/oligopeptide/nickel transport system permease component